MKILIDESTVKQALDFAESICGGRCNAEYNPCEARDLAEEFRSALDAAEKAEPVAWLHKKHRFCQFVQPDHEFPAYKEMVPVYEHPAPAVSRRLATD